MSNERTRDRGNLFEHAQKQKPSQPGFHGDCTIDGIAYEIRGWRREDQLTLSLAPPRGDRNTYPPDVFKGALEVVPAKPNRSGRGAAEAVASPAWVGSIESADAAYAVKGFEKQGKTALYWTLSFERVEKAAMPASPAWADPDDE